MVAGSAGLAGDGSGVLGCGAGVVGAEGVLFDGWGDGKARGAVDDADLSRANLS